jgi:hypothetical protein
MMRRWRLATKHNIKLYRLECILDKGFDPGPPKLLVWKVTKQDSSMIEDGYTKSDALFLAALSVLGAEIGVIVVLSIELLFKTL